MKTEFSQCQVIGKPPVKTWADYRQGCLDTYCGGHRDDGHLEAFRHGMETVFNLLEAEFPPAELCQAAPGLLRIMTVLGDWVAIGGRLPHSSALMPDSDETIGGAIRDVLAKIDGK